MLEPSDLATFIAIAEHRHFGRAADALGIVQSVASKRLRRLEDQLGGRLLERANRSSIQLTRAGELFLDQARATLASLQGAELSGRRIVRGRAGPLRIGYVFSAAIAGVLTKALTAVAQELPDVDPVLEMMETPAQIRAIAEGGIDIGFVRPRPTYPPGVEATHVHSEPVVLILSDRHRLARHRNVEAAALADARFIIPQFHEEVGLIDIVRDLARRVDLGSPVIQRTGDFISAASLAAAGYGVVLAPASLANLGLAGLVCRPIAGYSASLDIALLTSPFLHREVRDILQGGNEATMR